MNLHDTISQHRHVWCFGCSFTKYGWPTWADLLKDKYVNVTNLGRQGAGNVYIFNKIMEKYTQGEITDEDLIMVCWSGHFRLDMKFKDSWQTPGNLLNQNTYSKDFIKKHCDPNYFVERDLYLVHAVKQIFKDKIINFSMSDIDRFDQFNKKRLTLEKSDNLQKTIDTFFPSFYEVLWNNDMRTMMERADHHPTTSEHKQYMKQVFKVEL